jgi:putative ABC transport system substrate-binding protein
MRRRDFISLLGGAAAAWPLAARAQQAGLPVVAFVSARSPDDSTRYGAAFRKGLNGAGIIEGQQAAIAYHWLDGHYDQLPALMADLTRRRVAVIASFGSPASAAAKDATASIPIVFAAADDPTSLGLVGNLARPGGNATGINFFSAEIAGKRLGLLHELVPKAARIVVLVNPANASNAESTLRDTRQAARAFGLDVEVLKAASVAEIDAAFESFARVGADALNDSADAEAICEAVRRPTVRSVPSKSADREADHGAASQEQGEPATADDPQDRDHRGDRDRRHGHGSEDLPVGARFCSLDRACAAARFDRGQTEARSDFETG